MQLNLQSRAWLAIGLSLQACGVGFTEMADFTPRHPGAALAAKAEGRLLIIPQGQRPSCSFHVLGSVFYYGKAALLGRLATGGPMSTWDDVKRGECLNQLRRQAAHVGGDGIYDYPDGTDMGAAPCEARVFVCREERT